MRRTTTIATLAAICAVLVIAPSAAMGKTFKFEGPIDLAYVPSPAGFATSAPAMQLKVTFAGKKPKAIPGGTLKADGLYGQCVFGAYGCNAYPGDPPHCHWLDGMFGNQLKIKKKRFSGTFRDSGFASSAADGSFLRVTGRVGKRSVTGTVHAHGYLPARDGNPAATCDTGVLTWSAKR